MLFMMNHKSPHTDAHFRLEEFDIDYVPPAEQCLV